MSTILDALRKAQANAREDGEREAAHEQESGPADESVASRDPPMGLPPADPSSSAAPTATPPADSPREPGPGLPIRRGRSVRLTTVALSILGLATGVSVAQVWMGNWELPFREPRREALPERMRPHGERTKLANSTTDYRIEKGHRANEVRPTGETKHGVAGQAAPAAGPVHAAAPRTTQPQPPAPLPPPASNPADTLAGSATSGAPVATPGPASATAQLMPLSRGGGTGAAVTPPPVGSMPGAAPAAVEPETPTFGSTSTRTSAVAAAPTPSNPGAVPPSPPAMPNAPLMMPPSAPGVAGPSPPGARPNAPVLAASGAPPAAVFPPVAQIPTLQAPPSGAPEVSLLFIQYSGDAARRVASLRGPAGKLMLVHEGDTVEGMRVSAIRPDGLELEWSGTKFLLLAAR